MEAEDRSTVRGERVLAARESEARAGPEVAIEEFAVVFRRRRARRAPTSAAGRVRVPTAGGTPATTSGTALPLPEIRDASASTRTLKVHHTMRAPARVALGRGEDRDRRPNTSVRMRSRGPAFARIGTYARERRHRAGERVAIARAVGLAHLVRFLERMFRERDPA